MEVVKKLTNKQQLWLKYYLVNFNATEAAIKAGYSEKTAALTGHKNIIKCKIEIEKAKSKIADKNDIEISKIINELKLLGFSDIKDYLDTDPDVGTIRVKGFDEMPPGASRAIQSVTEKRSITEDKHGNRSIIYSTFSFKLWSKEKALEMLGRYKAMFTDKVDLKTNMPFNLILSADIKPDLKHNKNDNGKNGNQKTE